MSIIKTEAFVLKNLKYGDTSKIVSLFTKEIGKISAIVKGARNFKSKMCGTLETMNYVTVVIYNKYNRDLQFVSSAEYKTSFPEILNNFEKLQAAYRIIEIMDQASIENEVNFLVFELLINTYAKLNGSSKNYYCYILYFQIELAKILGINPDFAKITDKKETFFDGNEFYVRKALINPLQLISQNSIDNIESLEIKKNIVEQIISGYEKYLHSYTNGPRNFKSAKVFQELSQL